MKKTLPLVAIMGRPNVGKSTLLNRLSARMTAIVDKTPGVTRDRKYVRAKWRDLDFDVADTGGVGIEGEGWLSKEIERQAFFAAGEADLVVMLVDIQTDVTEDDLWLARRLRRLGKNTLLVVNKVDGPELEAESGKFYELGLGDPITVSAYHGLGIGDLLDRIAENIPRSVGPPVEPEVSIAIVGRPNVGKSSILNRLAEEERVLVHEEPHTTRDTIDTVVSTGERNYRILDTAGIRKKRTNLGDVEYYSSVRTFRAIEQADVVLLALDALQGPTEHDQRIASRIDSAGRSAALLINKWDMVEGSSRPDEIMESVSHKFRFAQHLPLLRVSALTGRGMDKVLPLVDEVYAQWNKRIPTPALNEFLSGIKLARTPPSKGGKRLKMYYATQASVAPPVIVIFANDAKLVKSDYRRFVVRQLREEYGFWGSPLRVRFRTATGKGRY